MTLTKSQGHTVSLKLGIIAFLVIKNFNIAIFSDIIYRGVSRIRESQMRGTKFRESLMARST